MKTNVKTKGPEILTHEGAKAARINAEQQLRRSVMSCLLWENEFYEEGELITDRISNLVPQVEPVKVALMAIEAREEMKLRHMPLFLVREMARHSMGKGSVADGFRNHTTETLTRIIQRADELAEFLALYWKGGKQPISHSVRRGLDHAIRKFNEYELAKYDRDGAVKLRDVFRLIHPEPDNAEQSALWKRAVAGELATPDTWEVELSKNDGVDKVTKWTRLLEENKLGALALIRNLRNMEQAGVGKDLIEAALRRMNTYRVLPFRFIAAAIAAPRYENVLDQVMLHSLSQMPKLPGKTIVVIDISGSMQVTLSAKSDMTRMSAACALGAFSKELCEEPVVYATSGSDGMRKHATALIPNRRGMALVDAIEKMQSTLGGGGIFLKQVTDYIREREGSADRMIVITDEQDCGIGSKDSPLLAEPLGKHNYLLNVASAKNGIGYGKKWIHIDGWSEAVFRYIQEIEKSNEQ